MSDNHHEEAHTGPIKTPKQLLMAGFFSFVVPIFVIIGLVCCMSRPATSLPQARPTQKKPWLSASKR
jgi:hypothetical protein